MMRILLVCGLLFQVSALKMNPQDPPRAVEDVNAEEDDLITEDQFDKELARFEPSQEMISSWMAATTRGQFAKVDRTQVPRMCQKDVNDGRLRNKQCRDPWSATHICSNAFETPNYRIGDMFFHRAYFNEAKLQPYMKSFFPDSIAAKYIKRKKGRADLEAMKQVLAEPEYKDYEKPANDTLVIHFRLGDVLHEKNSNIYAQRRFKSDKFYEKKVEEALSKGVKKAVLITGDHVYAQSQTENKNDKKAQLAAQVKKEMDDKIEHYVQLFEKLGMTITSKRINYNADCDLVYMANARYFAQGGGGFSRLIYLLVKNSGGEVFGS